MEPTRALPELVPAMLAGSMRTACSSALAQPSPSPSADRTCACLTRSSELSGACAMSVSNSLAARSGAPPWNSIEASRKRASMWVGASAKTDSNLLMALRLCCACCALQAAWNRCCTELLFKNDCLFLRARVFCTGAVVQGCAKRPGSDNSHAHDALM